MCKTNFHFTMREVKLSFSLYIQYIILYNIKFDYLLLRQYNTIFKLIV